MRLSSLMLAVIIAFVISAPAFAKSNSSTMSVSAVIENNCNILASPMVFSQTNVTGRSSVDGSARINIDCTSPTAFTVDMDRGTNSAGEQRRMVSEDGRYLNYQIFADASRSTEWGSSGDGVSGSVEGATGKSIMAYGRISTVDMETPSGVYQDTITVTLNF
ncbi:Csu type fimbrial protein [Pontixanthobacter aestiaquae]|nr:spore coat U domain-containing protein [Pontixanthobacter aestiaquae]